MTKIICLVSLSFLLFSCSENNSNNSEVQTNKATVVTNTNADVEVGTDEYILNKDYELFSEPYDTETADKVVVYEFFGYTCAHCFTFEPYIQKWLETKPDYVKFVRVPLNFQAGWADFQQAYLTAEAMGLVEQTHTQMFEALHKEHKRLGSMDEIADWYANETGADKEAFISTSGSFILDSKLRKADNMGFKMQITSTPTLIINGKYRAAKKIQNRDQIMKILDFLVEKEAQAMGLLSD